MKQAVRFHATLTPEQEETFIALAYTVSMTSCEELTKTESPEYYCYFTTEDEAVEARNYLKPFATNLSAAETILNRDWNAEWKKTIQPVQITDTIWVSPGWLEPPLKEGDQWIKIEPRMAFGTGHHETTRIASQALLTTKSPRKALLDIGTGSGILCFVGQIGGFQKATGYEIDPDCEENLKENLADNSGACDINFHIGTIDGLGNSAKFDTIVMNIIRLYSEPMLPAVKTLLTKDGEFIWSGILVEERDRVVAAAQAQGFALIDEGAEGEWWYGRFNHA